MKQLLNNIRWYSEQNLNVTFQSIATVFLEIIELDCEPYSITMLAKKANTTATSISRFCNKLGFSGYKQLLQKVLLELKTSEQSHTRNHSFYSNTDYYNSFVAIEKNLNTINEKYQSCIVDLGYRILNSKKVFLINNQKIVSALLFFQRNLLALGIDANTIDPYLIAENNWDEKMFSDEILIILPLFGHLSLQVDDNILTLAKQQNKKNLVICDQNQDNVFAQMQNQIVINDLNQLLMNQNDIAFYLQYFFMQIIIYIQTIKNK